MSTESTRSGLLRFITAGSVDDGKSTLIGRLLYDSKGLFADQVSSLEAASKRRGAAEIDLSLLTDGLVAEREQGITIDIAYRYFATPRRKFIIGDSPGHAQYTRNMVTAASTADVAVLLVDAREGLKPQTRRHAYLARWVGIPRVVLAVNKIDLLNYEQAAFESIRLAFVKLAEQLGFQEIQVIPLSALKGDMVVERGTALNWYDGPTLLEYLETVPARHDASDQAFRFPIQRVLRVTAANARPGSGFEGKDFRGYQGTIASGEIRVGDTITVQPAGATAKVTQILTADGNLSHAGTDQAVTLRLDTDIDVSRGDLFVSGTISPQVTCELNADVCWFDEDPLVANRTYLIKQGTATVRARFLKLQHRVDVETLNHVAAPDTLVMNDIGRVQLKTQSRLAAEPYAVNRSTGAFIVIDEGSNRTVAAGTII